MDRYIDCAQFYGNEKMVGDAIRGSGVPRSELFIASKVWGDRIYDGEEVSSNSPLSTLHSPLSTLDIGCAISLNHTL